MKLKSLGCRVLLLHFTLLSCTTKAILQVSIIAPPQNTTVYIGDDATISCGFLSATALPVTWIINGISFDQSTVVNSPLYQLNNPLNSRNVSLTAISINVTTTFQCKIRSAISTLGTVSVLGVEVIVTPFTQSVEITHTAKFIATIKGSAPFRYQWRKGKHNLTNETQPIIVLKKVSLKDQSYYRCYVTSSLGYSALSERVFLQVTINLPVITKTPTNTSLSLKSNFTSISLTCKADGESSYYWRRQIGDIPSSAIGVNTSNLTIVNLQLKDTGYYQCVATNGSGSIKSDYAKLTLTAFPSTIVTQPTDTSAAAPFSGVFTCSVIGYGYQNITWYKQSGTLPHKYQTNEMTSDGVTTSNLIIPNVTEEDIGKYYCQIWANNIGVRSEAAHLYYSGTPSKPMIAVLPSQQIELTVNNFTLVMKCLSHYMNFDYKWEKKNSKLPSRAQGINSEHLAITKLRPKDSGEYRCVMSNSTGAIASNYSLVTIKVAFPVIVKHPRSAVVEIYDVAVFECITRSYGSVSITWKRLNSELPVTTNVTTTKSLNGIKSVLKIEKSIGYYKGYYYCVSKNKIGRINSTFAYCNITVPCPQMIVAPKPVIVRPNATVIFSCLAWSYGGLVYGWNREGRSTLPSNNSVFFQDKTLPADTNCLTTMYELKIFNVQVKDEDLYCCEASNECGSNKQCGWLEVDTSPVISIQPKSRRFKDNERNVLALWIIATGLGPIYYQWQKYDPLSKNWVFPSFRAAYSLNLTFSIITEEDQGIYRCVVGNNDGHVVSDSANVTVYGSPKITYYSDTIVTFEGKKVNLVCNATNDGDAIDPVQISWYNGTKLLKSDGSYITIYNKHDTVTDQIQSLLILDNVNNTDDGEYICRAYNDPLCYTENTINLTVEYAPMVTIDPPQSPYTVIVESCPQLSDPENGKVFIISNGEVALIICDPGYVMIMGNPYLRCINGIWTPSPPKCKLP